MSYIESKIISLNASDAIISNSSYLSDINFNTSNLYIENDEVINTFIEVSNAQIPVSFYIINYTCNIYKININGIIYNYIIPVGNYNASQLVALLNTYHANLTATFDKITGKITWSHNQPFTIYNDFQYSIGSILGFNPNTINTSVGSSNPYTLTTPNLLNLMGIKKINIYSSNLELINYCSITNGNTSHTSLLSVIPNDATTYGLINYHNYSNIKTPIKNKTIDSINLQLKDENNNFINFNGVSYTITLILHIEKKQQNIINTSIINLLEKYNNNQNTETKKDDKPLSDLDLLTK